MLFRHHSAFFPGIPTGTGKNNFRIGSEKAGSLMNGCHFQVASGILVPCTLTVGFVLSVHDFFYITANQIFIVKYSFAN